MIGVVFGALAKADPTARTAAALRHDQRALARRPPRGRAALGHVLLLRRRARRQSQSDGLNHANNPISTATIPPAEILEASYPVMFTQWALRPDSAGAGAHRGGMGAVYEIEVLSEGGADVALLGERGRHAPFGVNGGGPAALNRFAWQTADGWREPPHGLEGHGGEARQGPGVSGWRRQAAAAGATRRCATPRRWRATGARLRRGGAA